MRFALIGAAGFVAPRHMRAIRDLGHQLVATLDPHDSVGILDSLAPGCRHFVEFERFDRHLSKLRRSGQGVDYVSVCSPNYLHDAHCRAAMRAGADVICEKPLVLSPWNLDALAEMEHDTGRRVWTVLQLRTNPALIALRERRPAPGNSSLYYSTPRGPWYGSSWKGDEARSGGVLFNVGVHLFDFLLWLYGPARHAQLTSFSPTQASGLLQHGAGEVSWHLSLDGAESKRVLHMADGDQDLSDGFKDAHTVVYAETLAGRGFGIEDARPAVELVHALRSQRGRL